MKALALIGAALLAGAAVGMVETGCTCGDDGPYRFQRVSATYSSTYTVPSYQLTLAADLRTATETFELDGHSYEIVYAAASEPRLTTEAQRGSPSLQTVTPDGHQILVDLPTLRSLDWKYLERD